MLNIFAVLGLIPIMLLGWLFLTYNRLVTLRNRVREAWAQIDVQLKRRSSLIPNLVEVVKGYAKHEKEVFENVTKARSALMQAKGPTDAAAASAQMSTALKSLFAVAENYPDLKASANFKTLQDEIADTETKVAASRQFYNTNVMSYNNSLEVMPSSLIAGIFKFTKSDFFQATEAEKKDVQVKM